MLRDVRPVTEPENVDWLAVTVEALPVALAVDRDSEDEGAPVDTVDMLVLPEAIDETVLELSITN